MSGFFEDECFCKMPAGMIATGTAVRKSDISLLSRKQCVAAFKGNALHMPAVRYTPCQPMFAGQQTVPFGV